MNARFLYVLSRLTMGVLLAVSLACAGSMLYGIYSFFESVCRF